MEWPVIVLGIIIIILIYVLYVYFVSKSSVISKSANLKEGGNEPITAITSGQSTRYAYGIWVYVNTWDSTRKKTIFSRKNNIHLYLAADFFILLNYLFIKRWIIFRRTNYFSH
jgi:hypothetical protein